MKSEGRNESRRDADPTTSTRRDLPEAAAGELTAGAGGGVDPNAGQGSSGEHDAEGIASKHITPNEVAAAKAADPQETPDIPGAVEEGGFRANTERDPEGAVARERDRGREALSPAAIPLKGWWDIVRRVFQKLIAQNVSILSAGVAFYAMLALFPALGAIVTTYALIADPSDVPEHFNQLSGILPPDVASIIDRQLTALASRNQGLGLQLVLGLLFAIWSARRGVDALVRAITVAYDEKETRNILKMNALTYVLTFGAVMLLVTTIALLVALPTALAFLPLSALTTFAARAGSWVIFFGVMIFAISLLYRFAPPRRSARWRWLSPGAFLATVLWVAGSAGFSLYVTSFGNYNETYGTLGAIIVLLLWFFLSAFSIVLGAATNAEMEHQTARDTTVGGAQPMGERGAYVADTLGEIP